MIRFGEGDLTDALLNVDIFDPYPNISGVIIGVGASKYFGVSKGVNNTGSSIGIGYFLAFFFLLGL